jgi:uncharacterized protein
MRWADAIVPSTVHPEFWAGLRNGRLVACHCEACGRWSFYPRAVCPHCGALAPLLSPLGGDGVVYSVTTVRRPLFEDWGPEPYDVALVDMEEGVRVMGRIVGRSARARIGDAVRVTFLDAGDDRPWYGFTPAAQEAPS